MCPAVLAFCRAAIAKKGTQFLTFGIADKTIQPDEHNESCCETMRLKKGLGPQSIGFGVHRTSVTATDPQPRQCPQPAIEPREVAGRRRGPCFGCGSVFETRRKNGKHSSLFSSSPSQSFTQSNPPQTITNRPVSPLPEPWEQVCLMWKRFFMPTVRRMQSRFRSLPY